VLLNSHMFNATEVPKMGVVDKKKILLRVIKLTHVHRCESIFFIQNFYFTWGQYMCDAHRDTLVETACRLCYINGLSTCMELNQLPVAPLVLNFASTRNRQGEREWEGVRCAHFSSNNGSHSAVVKTVEHTWVAEPKKLGSIILWQYSFKNKHTNHQWALLNH
jgi:hypothetical protein